MRHWSRQFLNWHKTHRLHSFASGSVTLFTRNTSLKMETVITEMIEFLMERFEIDEDEATEFALELEDNGIETKEQFDDAYFGDYGNTYYPEREFAQNFYEELGEINVDNPLYSFIDWQSVWDRQLRYDFFNINGHFFRNI